MRYLSLCIIITYLSACYNSPENNSANLYSKNDERIVFNKDTLSSVLQTFVNDSSLKNASIGFYVYDDNKKQSLIELNPDLALIPASILKLITTTIALNYLGSDKKFLTLLLYDGKISGKVLKGNLYIKGYGDPALGSKFFQETYADFIQGWVNDIRKLGIDSIDGKVIADATYFDEDMYPPTWSWGELGDYYCTAMSGLAVYDNMFKLKFDASQRSKILVSEENQTPFIPDFYIENKTTTEIFKKEAVYILGAPYSNQRILRGTVPNPNQIYEIKGAIPDPAYLLAFQFNKALLENNVVCSKQPTTLRIIREQNVNIYNTITNTNKKEISRILSPDLAGIVKLTNLHSNNLFAEAMLNHIGLKYYGDGNTENGCKAILQLLEQEGINTSGLKIFDGSGISRYNSVTSRQIVDVLMYAKHNPKNFEILYNSLPVAGESGTLKNFGKKTNLRGKIRAKTGTMSRVRTYAGFIETNSGKQLYFALIINNFNGESKDLKPKIEDLLILVADYF